MASRFLGEPKANADSPYAVSANKVRALSMQTVFGVLGIAMGVLIANVVGLDAFQFVEYSLLSIEQQSNYQYLPTWWGMACTGAAMGLGASPMHNFIAAMEQAKRFRKLSNRLK